MQCNFIKVFDSQINNLVNSNAKIFGQNGKGLESEKKQTLSELDAAGHVVRDVTYEQLNSLSCILADVLRSIIRIKVENVRILH